MQAARRAHSHRLRRAHQSRAASGAQRAWGSRRDGEVPVQVSNLANSETSLTNNNDTKVRVYI